MRSFYFARTIIAERAILNYVKIYRDSYKRFWKKYNKKTKEWRMIMKCWETDETEEAKKLYKKAKENLRKTNQKALNAFLKKYGLSDFNALDRTEKCMRFRVKTNDEKILRKYGFKPREEWLDNGALYDTNVVNYVRRNYFYLFKMDEENPSKVAVEENFQNALFEGVIDTNNTLWFNIAPGESYRCGMNELLLMMDIIYQMTKDGILEKIEVNEKYGDYTYF